MGMMYTCDICNKTYSTNFNRLKHIRKIHDQNMYLKKSNINCARCQRTFKHLKDLREHLTNDHKENIRTIIFAFENFSQFKEWKRKEEAKHKCWYVATRGATKMADGRMKKEFVCHRSGGKRICKNRKKNLKDSCKLNTTCPASIETIISVNGTVDVTFYSSHIDHSYETKYLSLSREERKSIAMKLAQGYTFDDILKFINDSKKSENLSERYYAITKKDLHNIKTFFNLKKNMKEADKKLSDSLNNQQYIDKKFIECDVQFRHRKGLHINPGDISILNLNKRLLWQIKTHVVEFLQPFMCNCNIKCLLCNICTHMFKCTCYDATVNENTICSHIHAVTNYVTKDGTTLLDFYTRNKWKNIEMGKLLDWKSEDDININIRTEEQLLISEKRFGENFDRLENLKNDNNEIIICSIENIESINSDENFSAIDLDKDELGSTEDNCDSLDIRENDNDSIIICSVDCDLLFLNDQSLFELNFNECNGSYFVSDDPNFPC